jgi:hypothetical protein
MTVCELERGKIREREIEIITKLFISIETIIHSHRFMDAIMRGLVCTNLSSLFLMSNSKLKLFLSITLLKLTIYSTFVSKNLLTFV